MLQRTGKRSAVLNNSGLPVDHSGPGLGVGPTPSATAGRKPEACPSDCDVSQRKSGRESEGSALSGTSAASGELRNEATQRSSSLDSIQINRNTHESIYCTPAVGRNKNCGRFSLSGTSADGRTRRYIRVDCKCWDCRYCAPRKASKYKRAIRET